MNKKVVIYGDGTIHLSLCAYASGRTADSLASIISESGWNMDIDVEITRIGKFRPELEHLPNLNVLNTIHTVEDLRNNVMKRLKALKLFL